MRILAKYENGVFSVTKNTYGHILAEMKRQTARQMDAVFAPVAVKMAVKPMVGKVN